MTLINELKSIGLSEKEAKVYLATLELSQESVQNIAKKSGLNRATTYVILESLIKQGLCSTFQQGKKTKIVASSPDALQGIFEMQKKEIDERRRHFESIMPQLNLINNSQADKPKVKFFEGRQGLVSCIDEFLSGYNDKSEQVRMIYNKDRLDGIFNMDERSRFKSIRLKRQIKSKVIYNFSTGIMPDTVDGVRVKVDSKKYPISCDIGIYGDSVRIASLGKKLSAVLIKDREIANTLKTIFDLAWDAAKSKK